MFWLRLNPGMTPETARPIGVATDCREAVSLPAISNFGLRLAPASRAAALACSTRANEAARSRFWASARSMILFSSESLNPVHQVSRTGEGRIAVRDSIAGALW